ncbi:MAG TPA: SIMPL domain-containing protein [Gaiellaceae bacterium]|nr:SIMPL domain-containing protein [Gaiellaceae bacterium]
MLGTGESSDTPDQVTVRFTIGSLAGELTELGPAVESDDTADIDRVVAALKNAGAEEISIDPFAQGPYSPISGPTTQVTFTSTDPAGVAKLLATARTALKEKKKKPLGYELQGTAVVFGLSNCAAVEEQAWSAAFTDAHARAAKLASLAGVELGPVLAVSEATFTPSVYAPGTTGCQSLVPRSSSVLTSQAVENTARAVQIGVTLQVTYAIASG